MRGGLPGQRSRGAIVVAVLVATACSDSSSTILAPKSASLAAATGAPKVRTAELERLEVCKDYALGCVPPTLTDFVASDGTNSYPFSLAPGGCQEVLINGGGSPVLTMSVTETVPAGFSPSYVVTTISTSGQNTGNSTDGNSATGLPLGGPTVAGALVVFTNTPLASGDGRMTGGGFTAGIVHRLRDSCLLRSE